MSKDKLKKCPFCGGEAEIIQPDERNLECRIICAKCVVSTNWYCCELQAIQAWNRRSHE
jgi:Lar family restriction alleviation protein